MAKVLELQFQHQSFQWISGWFPLGLTGLISLLSKEPLKSLLQHDNSKPSIVQHSAFFMVQLLHPYKTAGKTIALIIQNFFGKVMSLLFNMLPRFVIPFLPRNKCLLILWPKSTVCRDFGDQKNQPPPPFIWHEMMDLNAMILVFWMLSFKPTFSLSSFTLIKRLFTSSLLSAIRVVSSAYLRLLIFLLAILIQVCDLFSPTFCMMYSAYKLNKQGNSIQPWHTPFPILKRQSIVLCMVLITASYPVYRFLKRQVKWFGTPISLRIVHSLLWSPQSRL